METRILGKTELRLSELSLGTWGLAADAYGRVSDDLFRSTTRAALEQGVTTFDMSPLWGDGRSERIVAEIAAERREEMQYVTRAGARWVDGRVHHRFDPASLMADCEGSLKRLKTDHVDLLLLHAPPEDIYRRDDLSVATERLVADGKIRAWGVSVTTRDQASMALAAGAQAIAIPHNIIAGDALHEVQGEVQSSGAGVLATSPLCYGLLAGRWNERRKFTQDDHRGARWSQHALVERIRTVNMLRFLVHDETRTMVAAALRYVLANPVVTTAVLGARRPDQIEGGAREVGEPPYLPSDDIARIPQVLAAAEA
jgi:aryl-alcohol dehydrogenase-like predicted oxidoreductase